jgi:trimeric autotransporter adhesin
MFSLRFKNKQIKDEYQLHTKALSMRIVVLIILHYVIYIQFSITGYSQSDIITTYAGSGPPTNVILSIKDHYRKEGAIALDGHGGFYISSTVKHSIYHIKADGQLHLSGGIGIPGYGGDGKPASSAQLKAPEGLAVDSIGNLYIADSENNRIRKVTLAGDIITVAGNGKSGYSGNIGDGGMAVSAGLNYPKGVAVDSIGNIYIADTYHGLIRKVTPSGIISTVAGGACRVFNVAIDRKGNLYIPDRENHRILKVNAAGMITTIAGDGKMGYSGDGGSAILAQLASPHGVAVDSAGNIYIADTYNGRIRKVTPAGIITTIAGTYKGSYLSDSKHAFSGQLFWPQSIVIDSADNIYFLDSSYIADKQIARIHKITPNGKITTVFDENGILFSDNDETYMLKQSRNTKLGENTTSLYGGDYGQATLAKLYNPSGVSLDSVDNLYIADFENSRIRKITPTGLIVTVAGNGDFGYAGNGGKATSAQLAGPHSVAADSAGNMYIASIDDLWIRKVTSAGKIKEVEGSKLKRFKKRMGDIISGENSLMDLFYHGPYGVAVDSAGNLYIADTFHYRICKVTPKGKVTIIAGNEKRGYSGDGGKAISAQLDLPCGIAVDSIGNVYIADSQNHCIRKVTPAGYITTIAGNGNPGFGGDGGQATSAQLASPFGVAVDSSGNLYIADTQNNRIRKITPSGLITTVAGDGNEGYGGDGGFARSAQLRWPKGIAVDRAGNLYIADTGNNRIRKVMILSK